VIVTLHLCNQNLKQLFINLFISSRTLANFYCSQACIFIGVHVQLTKITLPTLGAGPVSAANALSNANWTAPTILTICLFSFKRGGVIFSEIGMVLGWRNDIFCLSPFDFHSLIPKYLSLLRL